MWRKANESGFWWGLTSEPPLIDLTQINSDKTAPTLNLSTLMKIGVLPAEGLLMTNWWWWAISGPNLLTASAAMDEFLISPALSSPIDRIEISSWIEQSHRVHLTSPKFDRPKGQVQLSPIDRKRGRESVNSRQSACCWPSAQALKLSPQPPRFIAKFLNFPAKTCYLMNKTLRSSNVNQNLNEQPCKH